MGWPESAKRCIFCQIRSSEPRGRHAVSKTLCRHWQWPICWWKPAIGGLNLQDLPSFRFHRFFPPLRHGIRSTPSDSSLHCTLKTMFLLLLRSLQIFLWCCPMQSSEWSVGNKQCPWQLRSRLPHPPVSPSLGPLPSGFCSSCPSKPDSGDGSKLETSSPQLIASLCSCLLSSIIAEKTPVLNTLFCWVVFALAVHGPSPSLPEIWCEKNIPCKLRKSFNLWAKNGNPHPKKFRSQ